MICVGFYGVGDTIYEALSLSPINVLLTIYEQIRIKAIKPLLT